MKKLLLLALLGATTPVWSAPASTSRARAAPLKWPTFRPVASKKSVPQVAAIQYLLRSRGFYKGKPDGIFGAQTAASVRAFQRKNGLIADGVVGTRTFPKLIQILRRGSQCDAVRAVQTLLREPVAEDGTQPFRNFPVDGVFGAGTDKLLRNYQGEWVGYPEGHVLKSDGIAGPQTWCWLFGGSLN